MALRYAALRCAEHRDEMMRDLLPQPSHSFPPSITTSCPFHNTFQMVGQRSAAAADGKAAAAAAAAAAERLDAFRARLLQQQRRDGGGGGGA